MLRPCLLQLPHCHPDRSEEPAFSFLKYEPLAASLLAVSLLTATLTRPPQLTDNTATLSPSFATLANRVNPNPFVCHSYKKHPGVVPLPARIDLSAPHPVFAIASNPLTASPLFLPPAKSHHSRVTNFLEINTSKTRTKQTTLTTFRINIYEKRRGMQFSSLSPPGMAEWLMSRTEVPNHTDLRTSVDNNTLRYGTCEHWVLQGGYPPVKRSGGSPSYRWARHRPASNVVWKVSSGIKMTNMQQSGQGRELYLNCFH